MIRFVAAGTPYRSATAPIRVTPMPPVPMANPAMAPEAVAIRFGNSSWAITIVTEKVETIVPPRSAADAKTSHPDDRRNRKMRGIWRRMEKKRSRRCPNRSASGPPITVPTVPDPRKKKRRVATYAGSLESCAL